MALSCHAIAKKLGSRTLLSEVSLSIAAGEIVGLLGPNGAGKTSTFYALMGLSSVDSGDITLEGQNITGLPLYKRAHLGLAYLPQEPSVFRGLSVRKNILAILELYFPDKTARYQTLEHLLEEFGLTAIQDTLGAALSGGERRRVEIARALAQKPRYLLLDEPFAGVDPLSIVDIKGLIRLLAQKNIGILITDHNVRETLDICQRAYIFNAGSIIAEGDPASLLDNQKVRDIYLGEQFLL